MLYTMCLGKQQMALVTNFKKRLRIKQFVLHGQCPLDTHLIYGMFLAFKVITAISNSICNFDLTFDYDFQQKPFMNIVLNVRQNDV